MAKPAMEMFRERLLRKAYRPGRRPAECPVDVFQCEEEFSALVAKAEATQPMDRTEWHRLCNEFSDKWDHVCHWVHPSRLADFLEEAKGLKWVGEYPVRTEAQKSKAKVKSNIKAQRFLCPECDVECNSYAQYVIHAQGSKHLDIVEALRKREAACGRTYTSPGAVPLDTDGRPGGSPQAYFKKSERDADSSSEKSSTPSVKSEKSGRRVLQAYTALLAVSTISMVSTHQQQQHSQQEYLEPSLDTYGCWGGTCGDMPYCLPTEPLEDANEPRNQKEEDDDDEDKKKKKKILFSDAGLNPDAIPFMSEVGRAYSLPTHDRWCDESDSASTAESTPAHSSSRSVSSRGCDDPTLVAHLTELIEDHIRAGTLTRDELLKKLRAADVHAVSAALVAATATCDVSTVAEIAEQLSSVEVNEALGADLTARVSAGPRTRCTDNMDMLQADFIDEQNLREYAAYASSFALALSLCCTGVLAVDVLRVVVDRFCANITSTEQLPASAAATLTRFAQKLPHHVDTPELSTLAPRGLRQVVAALE